MLFLKLSVANATYLTPHRFHKYPESRINILDRSLDASGMAINNCEACEEIRMPDYVIKGFKDLISYRGNIEKRKKYLEEKELSIVVDFHLNYVHLFYFEKDQDVTTVNIVKTYKTSMGVGGLTNRKRSGGTPPGIHYIWRKQDGGGSWKKYYVIDSYKRDKYSPKLGVNLTSRKFHNTVLPTKSDEWWAIGYVTTRILRLQGLEGTRNNNSKRRSILFHGTQEEGFLGMHKSGGCLRMSAEDVIDLYRKVNKLALVNIVGDFDDVLKDGKAIKANNKPQNNHYNLTDEEKGNLCKGRNMVAKEEEIKAFKIKNYQVSNPDGSCK